MNSRTRIFLVAFLVFAGVTHAQLSATFYDTKCPRLKTIVRRAMRRAVKKEPRVAASMLRLFFHDCFVQGCDASILLDDTSTFTGEKNAGPNRHSLRSFKVVDTIKKRLEATCNGTVSCADILALAARDGVKLLRGPTWIVPLGRRDSRTANQNAANSQLPGPGSNLTTLISMFSAKGLNAREMVALSGGHTIGKAKCSSFRDHIYNDNNINAAFAKARKANCPNTTDGTGDTILAPLDKRTPNRFDNRYYKNLVTRRGLLHSDQELFNNGSQDYVVRAYVKSNALFRKEFAAAMIKMGNISPLTGTNGEIRRNCRRLN